MFVCGGGNNGFLFLWACVRTVWFLVIYGSLQENWGADTARDLNC